jgi:uncharacterized protein YukE
MSDTDTAAVAEQAAENVDAWISQDPAKMELASRPDNGIPDRKPGDSVYTFDPAKDAEEAQAAPFVKAATTLSDLGPEGQALVQEWGGHTSQDFQENLSYAKAAFADISKNRPDLIAKVDASGLGNDPAILKILAEHGRLQAFSAGDFTTQKYRAMEGQRPMPQSNSAAQRELDKIYKETPPGSPGYREKAVQDRVMQLNEMIHGTEPAVGQGGRRL